MYDSSVLSHIPVRPDYLAYSVTQYEILKKHIRLFEESLDDEHEAAIYFASFGDHVLMRVTEISFEESVVLVFKGYVNDQPATLIQHLSQLNFLLTSVQKSHDHPKRCIGFQPDQ